MLTTPTLSAYSLSLTVYTPFLTLTFTFRSHSESMLSLPFFPLIGLYLSSFFSLLTSFFKFYCLLVFSVDFTFLLAFCLSLFLFYNLLSLFPISSLSLSLPPVPLSSYLCSHTLCSLFLISDIPYLTFFLITSYLTGSFIVHSLASLSPYCLVAGVLDEPYSQLIPFSGVAVQARQST